MEANYSNKWNFKTVSLIFTVILILMSGFSSAQESQEVVKNQMKFGRLLRLIDSYYVDTTNVDALTEKAIVELLSGLDPHSVYISKEEVAKMNEPLEGNFEGIGITFNIFRDTLLVTSVIAGGPSEKVGLMAGDRIVEIDGKKITNVGLKNDDVFKYLKGPKGTQVNLSVLRKNHSGLLEFKIIRDKIPIYSIDASYMINKETGYIKMNKFAATTYDEFREALVGLKKQDVKNLILDLRGNGGGYMKSAIDISDEFLSADKMVVYTQGTNSPKRDYKATSAGSFEDGKVVVLIDEGSASASEIVTGAIQDWDRGIVLGRRSFGKGLVQQPFFLTDGSMVRLTTAHYYTPSGRCIQKPYKEGTDEYRKDFLKRIEKGEMFSADSISFPDSLQFKTLTYGRKVFGGGGIMPDIFIPMDTSKYYAYYNQLMRNNVVYNYVLGFEDSNRGKILKKYDTFDKFNDKFEVTGDMINEVTIAGEKAKVQKNQESLEFTSKLMKKEIKALIARDIYDKGDFYKVYNQDDKVILKAVEILKNGAYYSYLDHK
jgi:carboxyl-terminal processing protease